MTTSNRSTVARRRAAIWGSPTRGYVEDGYRFVENSDDWKGLCASLPCFEALEWPGYDAAEHVIELRGEPVVIQLWRGLCQKFLLMTHFPGGVGAEVGVYRRQPGRPWPRSLAFLPALSRPSFSLRAGLDPDRDLWWPAPDLQTELTFTLVNPITKLPFFGTPAQRTYWLCKWMDEDDYKQRYRQRMGTAYVPALPTQFILDFTVDGRRFRWDLPQPGGPREGAVHEL